MINRPFITAAEYLLVVLQGFSHGGEYQGIKGGGRNQGLGMALKGMPFVTHFL